MSRVRWKHWLKLLLMVPVLPCFLWGPFMHPYVNFRALKKARKEAEEGDSSVNMELVEACEENLDDYVFGGNSADTVSTNHVTTGLTIYDYAHNAVPDHAKGVPFFGYALVDQWKQEGKRDKKDLALACGWLGHQLADWYPHYACIQRGGVLSQDPTGVADEINSFSGFADAHLVFGDDYYPSVLSTNSVIEHALIELFYDIVAVHEDNCGLFTDPHQCLAMFSEADDNLLTVTSERYRGRYTRIPPEHIPSLTKNFEQVIFLMRLLIETISAHKPGLADSLRLRYWRDEFVEQSVDRVVDLMFRQDFPQISQKAVPPEEKLGSGDSYKLINSKMGSTLFEILHSISKPLQKWESETLLKAIEDPLVLLGEGLPTLLRLALGGALKRWLSNLIDVRLYRSSLVEKNGLASFLLTLLIEDDDDPIERAIQSYKRAAPPIVTLDKAPSGVMPSVESVADLFRKGNIPIRISPAVLPDDPDLGAVKRLDRSTLIFRIDGYDVTHRPDLFDVAEERWENGGDSENGGELVLNVGLRDNLPGKHHHIFVDIHDQTGTHSKYLDLEVTIDDATPVKEVAATQE